MGEADWFDTGAGAIKRATSKGASDNKNTPFRFFLRPETSAIVAFCDGDRISEEGEPMRLDTGGYKEHEYTALDGTYRHYASCVGLGGGCLLCERGLMSYNAWPFTIIQVSPGWKDREGVEHKNEKKLLISKTESMQRFLRYIQQKRGLCGTVWDAFRSSKKSYLIGDVWDFQQKVEGKREGLARHLGVPIEQVTPFNYREILKPKTRTELEAEVNFAVTKQNQEDRKKAWANNRGGDAAPSGQAPAGQAGSRRSAEVPY